MFTITMAIFIPFIAALFIPFIYQWKPRATGWFALLFPLILFVALLRLIPTIANGEVIQHSFQWIPSAQMFFTTYVDGLSLIFALLITGVGTLVTLYSIYYLSSRESLGHFYVYLFMFMGAMLGVVFSDNMMILYAFWELTSISSFLLIAFWFYRKQSRYGAQKSMLITVFGGIMMLAGFIMLYTMTGSFSIRENIAAVTEITSDALFIPAMLLILLGAFTKSAQFPFHIWLPDAMEAPTPVSAYLHSATMVKAGIYLVARFTGIFGGDAIWFYVVSIVGIFTLFWGSFNAVRQTDLKALLAYSTISQLGLVMGLFGFGSAALYEGYSAHSVLYAQATFAALFHLINHSTFKGALFMIVGIVDLNVGTRDVRRLGGLMAFMPVTFTIALIGSFSMAGLPPFNGFLSKEMFFEAMVSVRHLDFFSLGKIGILFPVFAWLGSVFTFVYSLIIVFQTFFGKHYPERLDREAHEAPIGMLISPLILSVLIVLLFIFPNHLAEYVLRPAMNAVYPSLPSIGQSMPNIALFGGVNAAFWMTVAVVIAGSLLYLSFKYWRKIYKVGPFRWTLDRVYNGSLLVLDRGANLLTNRYMTGYLRHYLLYIFAFFLLIITGTIVFVGGLTFDFSNDAPVDVNEYILIFVMILAGVLMVFVRSRMTAILLNGVLGYSIALFFVIFRAPDLALTQIVIETVTTTLFLLAFYFLPKMKKEIVPKTSKIVNGTIAVLTGLVVTVIGLSVQGNKAFSTIATYFENAYELTGGKNIVNTILGDFRAFDTMLEVVVLFIAGLGVYVLVKLKPGKEGRDFED